MFSHEHVFQNSALAHTIPPQPPAKVVTQFPQLMWYLNAIWTEHDAVALGDQITTFRHNATASS